MNQEILDLLDKHPAFLATKGTCGNPRLRPIQSALYYEGKLYFCTSKEKNMYKHMQNHAGIEICAFDDKETWIRIRGEAKFVESSEVKSKMFAKYPLLKNIYESPNNSIFAVFYLEKMSVKIQNFSGREEVIKDS